MTALYIDIYINLMNSTTSVQFKNYWDQKIYLWISQNFGSCFPGKLIMSKKVWTVNIHFSKCYSLYRFEFVVNNLVLQRVLEVIPHKGIKDMAWKKKSKPEQLSYLKWEFIRITAMKLDQRISLLLLFIKWAESNCITSTKAEF